MFPSARSICGLIVFAALTAGLRANSAQTVQPAAEWDALFQRNRGWIGADGNFSIPLSKDTTLWLFSDTWVGEVRDGKRIGARMINNSIALQHGRERPEFFHGTARDGKPESFIKPKDGRGYFWLFHGIRTRRGLYLFFNQVETVRPNSAFGFHPIGNWLAHVANPDDPPARWKIGQTKIPFSTFSTKGILTFGSAVLRDGNFIYIYGADSRAKKLDRGMVVARVPEDQIAEFKQWRFWSDGQWQKDATRLTTIASNIPTEFSVSFQPEVKRYVLVYSHAALSGKIFMQTSPSPQGPWDSPTLLYECPEMKWSDQIFCYAAKAHPELPAGSDELLITYAANSRSFVEVLNDARLYWPRFVRVRFNSSP